MCLEDHSTVSASTPRPYIPRIRSPKSTSSGGRVGTFPADIYMAGCQNDRNDRHFCFVVNIYLSMYMTALFARMPG